MALRYVAILFWYSRARRTRFGQLVFPLVLVDLVYGGFFEGTLFYALMWMELSGTGRDEGRTAPFNAAMTPPSIPRLPATHAPGMR
jgi:hypothetical protein